MILSDSFDDAKVVVLPHPSTEKPPPAALARAEMRKRHRAYEAMAVVPKSARQPKHR